MFFALTDWFLKLIAKRRRHKSRNSTARVKSFRNPKPFAKRLKSCRFKCIDYVTIATKVSGHPEACKMANRSFVAAAQTELDASVCWARRRKLAAPNHSGRRSATRPAARGQQPRSAAGGRRQEDKCHLSKWRLAGDPTPATRGANLRQSGDSGGKHAETRAD